MHPGTGTLVVRVVRPHHVAPLLSGLLGPASGALVVPPRRILGGGRTLNVEASVGHSRVGRAGLEDVWVSAGHDVSHHSSRAGAGDEGPVEVSAVVLDSVFDHVGDGLAVAAAIVCESCVCVEEVM